MEDCPSCEDIGKPIPEPLGHGASGYRCSIFAHYCALKSVNSSDTSLYIVILKSVDDLKMGNHRLGDRLTGVVSLRVQSREGEVLSVTLVTIC
jgi:hypothetical protein